MSHVTHTDESCHTANRLWLCICKIMEFVYAKMTYIYAARRHIGFFVGLFCVAV